MFVVWISKKKFASNIFEKPTNPTQGSANFRLIHVSENKGKSHFRPPNQNYFSSKNISLRCGDLPRELTSSPRTEIISWQTKNNSAQIIFYWLWLLSCFRLCWPGFAGPRLAHVRRSWNVVFTECQSQTEASDQHWLSLFHGPDSRWSKVSVRDVRPSLQSEMYFTETCETPTPG